ncbi:hypothetical protein V8G69_04120 [Gaetbulibacter sp. M235]|uniref:hypothetical protein n=1 Tax=Gaetbulibacter sp. M235 TaxID=3126510 RepID=UPI00374E40C0
MKIKLFAFTAIASILFIVFSCDTNDSSNSKNIKEYKASLENWNYLKLISGASYRYEISTGSVFGFGSKTQITVENDIVVSRTHESYSIYDNDNNYLGYDNRLILNSYTEDIENLGANPEGALPLTIDQLYDTCFSDYLSVDTDSNTITFNVDDFNIIKNCYYIPNGCQDDCTFGITITNFEWLGTSN